MLKSVNHEGFEVLIEFNGLVQESHETTVPPFLQDIFLTYQLAFHPVTNYPHRKPMISQSPSKKALTPSMFDPIATPTYKKQKLKLSY